MRRAFGKKRKKSATLQSRSTER